MRRIIANGYSILGVGTSMNQMASEANPTKLQKALQSKLQIAFWKFSLDTPQTLSTLCEAGADCSLSWADLIAKRPNEDPEQMKAFWESMKILLAHCPNKKIESFSKDLHDYCLRLTVCQEEDFEIIGMFLLRGADLLFEQYNAQTARTLLISTIVQEANFAKYRNLLENIPSLEARLSCMSRLNEICMELGSNIGVNANAQRLVQFGTDLGNEVLTINQLKIVAGLLFLGVHQEASVLYRMPFEIILRLLLLSLENPESISENRAVKVARDFYVWKPAAPKDQSEKEAHAQFEQTFNK